MDPSCGEFGAPPLGVAPFRHVALSTMCAEWRNGGSGRGQQRIMTATHEAMAHFRAMDWCTVECLPNERVHSLARPSPLANHDFYLLGFAIPERENHIAGSTPYIVQYLQFIFGSLSCSTLQYSFLVQLFGIVEVACLCLLKCFWCTGPYRMSVLSVFGIL